MLAVLLIVILLILNGVGVYLYSRKRKNFVNQSDRINNHIPMREASKYRRMSIPSTITSDLTATNTRGYLSSYTTKSEHIRNSIPTKTTVHDILRTTQSELSNEKNDIDLSLEEFQRQALKEHNSMRSMHKKPPLKLTESLNIYAQVK